MGPQPIGRSRETPPAMSAAAKELLELMLAGKTEDISALAMPVCAREMAEFSATVPAARCDAYEIIATAHVNKHYYVKARLTGAQQLAVHFVLVSMRVAGRFGK